MFSLGIQAPLLVSTILLVLFLSSISEFVSICLARHGILQLQRARLHLAGKWSMPFLAGSIFSYTAAR